MNQQIIQRRQWLQWAALGAAGLYLPRSAWTQTAVGSNIFSLGVASGSPTHDSVVLWTRLMPPFAQPPGSAGVSVRWEVAHDDKFSRIVQSGQELAVAALAYSVHAEVQGLAPDRWYFYRFMVGDAVSAVGRTRTFPGPDAAVAEMRLGYASCQRWEHGYFSAYRHMAQENLDLVMFLGDYIYEYPRAANGVRTPPGGWTLALDDYRQRYATYKQDPDLQAMHATCPWLVTWDDHEVQNDYAGLTLGENGPDVPDFTARRTAAYQAFYEHMPVRASVLMRAAAGLASGAEMRIYSRVQFGQLASLTMLDARQYKSPQVCTPDGKRGSSTVNPVNCPAWNDPARTMLGLEQERWLDTAWGSTQGKSIGWNIVGQQSLIGQRDWKVGQEQSLWNDGWDGYSAARTRLTDSAQKNAVSNLVVLGGDVHENWVGQIKADYSQASSAAVGVEFCGTSITSRSGGNARLPETLAENPHFVFADAERKGYGVLAIAPNQLKTTLRVVSDVTRQDASIETLAQFSVRSGRAIVERI
ncbi:MAG: alkaline phosphatase D family protein [Polaromonas sp.]